VNLRVSLCNFVKNIRVVGVFRIAETVSRNFIGHGLLIGEPGRCHHGASHSLVVGLIGGLIFYRFVGYRLKGISKWRILGCYLLTLLSHPILDYFSSDTSYPFGVPLFWPFDGEYYISSISLFPDVQRNEDTVGSFFTSLMNSSNGWGVVIESLFAGSILFALLGFKGRSKVFVSVSCYIVSILCGLFYFSLQIKPNLI
jgi:hypothetical protein